MFIVPFTRESRQLSRLFDDSFDRVSGPVPGAESTAARTPALDVVESERAYSVKLDMPGVAKEDVKVTIEGRQVTVQAQAERHEERKDGDRTVYRERARTSYARSFSLPLEVDQAEAVAKLEHGVLTLTLPKRVARNASQITIN